MFKRPRHNHSTQYTPDQHREIRATHLGPLDPPIWCRGLSPSDTGAKRYERAAKSISLARLPCRETQLPPPPVAYHRSRSRSSRPRQRLWHRDTRGRGQTAGKRSSQRAPAHTSSCHGDSRRRAGAALSSYLPCGECDAVRSANCGRTRAEKPARRDTGCDRRRDGSGGTRRPCSQDARSHSWQERAREHRRQVCECCVAAVRVTIRSCSCPIENTELRRRHLR